MISLDISADSPDEWVLAPAPQHKRVVVHHIKVVRSGIDDICNEVQILVEHYVVFKKKNPLIPKMLKLLEKNIRVNGVFYVPIANIPFVYPVRWKCVNQISAKLVVNGIAPLKLRQVQNPNPL